MADYAKKKNDELAALCKERGLAHTGKKADLVLIKNDQSPVMFPLLHPYGHVVFQAGRGDVHTVMVNGNVVKYDHQLLGDDLTRARQAIAKTVEYAQGPTRTTGLE